LKHVEKRRNKANSTIIKRTRLDKEKEKEKNPIPKKKE